MWTRKQKVTDKWNPDRSQNGTQAITVIVGNL
jgi:hypothetical protein